MALQKQLLSWPIDGGLDTVRSPLVIQPGSHLQLDNVVQVRKNEWRRRDGFTQVAADTSTSYADAFHIGNLGPSGAMAHDASAGPAIYRPTLTSNKWGALSASDYPSDITRIPVASGATNTSSGFAVSGNLAVLLSTTGLYVFDIAARAVISTATPPAAMLTARCAATSTHLVACFVDNAGNLRVYVVDVATGVVTGPTTIKTGMNATPIIDALWYGGSTITIVGITTTNTVRFIEYNPSTGALSTDTTIGGGVLASSALSLLNDPTASGIRFVAPSVAGGTPTTRVVRCLSDGSVQTSDQVEAISSTRITGVASSFGDDWTVVYQTSAGTKANYKTGGSVGTTAVLRGGNTSDISVDSMGWSEDGLGYWQCVLGLHSNSAADPQDTWIVASFPKGSSCPNFTLHSVIVPGQGATVSGLAPPYQATRTAAYTFQFMLPVLSQYTDDAGTVTRHHSLDIFTQKWLTSADIGVSAVGKPIRYKETAMLPANGIAYVDGASLRSLGVSAPPRTPTLTPAGGGSLTLLGEYQYVLVIEKTDADGNVWRSPPSIPALVTLTGANQTIGVAAPNWYSDEVGVVYTVAVYRTQAGGSSFRRIRSIVGAFSADVSFNDAAADTAIVDGELLYTEGLPPTEITPRMSHLAIFGDRLWGVNGDFRTELWPSRNLRPGRMPEFVENNVVDLDDPFGDITNVSSLDDKGVVFKKNAVYFVQGEGKNDDGSGDAHTWVQIASDAGAIPGSPVVSTGDMVFFVAERGIYAVDRAANLSWVGAPVDQYLHQPDVQAVETIFDACFVSTANEVRFVTTNYVLVYNRTFGTWSRWIIGTGFRRCIVVDGKMWLFKTDGTVWKETAGQLTDQGAAFTGVIRSPWIRPAEGGIQPLTAQQGIRLYRARVTFTRTSGGSNATLLGKIYRNNDDAKVETFTSGAIAGGTLSGTGEMNPVNGKCTSFSLALVLPSGDQTVRVDGFSAMWGARKGQLQVDGSSKWPAP